MRTSLELLKLLKEEYNKNAVSVLIGSGFSKNANPNYMNWDELLFDLVVFLYEEKIRNKYFTYKSTGPDPYIDFETYKKDEVKKYIKEIGYLNLVSQYIETKGYREAIDVYIEEHTPFIKRNSDGSMTNNMFAGTSFTENNLDAHHELLNCNWKQVYTTNYDNLLELTNDCFNMDYEEIKSDYELSRLSSKRGIIKVHGSLVEDSMSSKYEFDNDKSRRYIISRDDYVTYADKHQAFSYLMRTNLLTGVFCLIGFSGNDPNFLGWLEWMRDILDKDIMDSEKHTKKIYLLSIGNDILTTDRALFYQNHRIGIINIEDIDVLKELGIKNEAPIKTIFIQLFRYLRRDASHFLDNSNISRYETLWREILNHNITDEDINSLRKLRNPHFTPKQTNHQISYINQRISDKNWTLQNSELFAISANDCGLIPSIFQENKIGEMNNIPEWQEMQLLECAYTDEDFPQETILDKDIRTYFQILHYLFHLNFDIVQKLAEDWNPCETWIVNQASIIAEFAPSKAQKLLDTFLQKSDDLQQKYFAANLANILSKTYPFPYSYNEYKAQMLDNYWDISKEILNRLKDKDEKILPYGTTNRTFHFSTNNISVIESLRYLAFLAKSGFKLQYGILSLVTSNDWYSVFFNIFEYYPYPCLYYSLQLTDKNILKRIGQDYAYSEKLFNILAEILTQILKLIIDTKYINNSISYYVISSELFIAVKEEKWFDLFYKILNGNFIPYAEKISKYDEIVSFVKSAIHIIKEKEHIEMAFKLLLDNLNSLNMYLLTDLIYSINLSPIGELSGTLKHQIVEIFQNNSITQTYLLAASLYKYQLIDNELRKIISNKIISNKDNIKSTNIQVLFSLTHFTNNNSEAIQIIKNIILSHNIWNCGIIQSGATQPQYIALNKISKEIMWTKEEIEEITNNINTNIRNLKKSNFLTDNFFSLDYISFLIDMLDFIENIVISQYRLEQYASISNEIKLLIDKIIPFGSSFDIFYNMEEDITNMIKFLARCIDYLGTEKYLEPINILMSRALMKEKNNLYTVLKFIDFIVNKHFEALDNDSGIHKLILLLELYIGTNYKELNLPIPYTYELLHHIAYNLNKHTQINNDIITYWLKDEKINRFNISSITCA